MEWASKGLPTDGGAINRQDILLTLEELDAFELGLCNGLGECSAV